MNIQHLGWLIVSYDDMISVNCTKWDDCVSRLGPTQLHLLVCLLAGWSDCHKNLDGGRVSAQNRLHKMLVRIQWKGSRISFLTFFKHYQFGLFLFYFFYCAWILWWLGTVWFLVEISCSTECHYLYFFPPLQHHSIFARWSNMSALCSRLASPASKPTEPPYT